MRIPGRTSPVKWKHTFCAALDHQMYGLTKCGSARAGTTDNRATHVSDVLVESASGTSAAGAPLVQTRSRDSALSNQFSLLSTFSGEGCKNVNY
jgi:hypothetical protein